MPADPYAKTTRDGKTLDLLTAAALARAERRLGYDLTVTQGSYNMGGVSASAGTHDGGGVVDLMPWDQDNKVIALRASGFAAWYRPAIAGLWPSHIHAVLIGHAKLAPAAARQVDAYMARRNGLKDDGPDVDPGWTNAARYSVEAFHGDVERGKIDARVTKYRSKRKALLEKIKRALARRKSLPK